MSALPDFSNTHILVVGDVMLDRYWHGSSQRISPEAPVPVVNVAQIEERPGGAANVALNITQLGAKATLIGLVGQDEAADRLRQALMDKQVACELISIPNHPTTTKLRVTSQQQQLIRVDFEAPFTHRQAFSELSQRYAQALSQCDLVVMSDYAKGALTDVKALIAQARRLGKPVIVDPKSLDFSVYAGATLLTPNYKEFTAITGKIQNDVELEEKARSLLEQHDLKAILITRGQHGMSLVSRQNQSLHLPAHAREVFDVTGAGDTVISTLGIALATGLPLNDAIHLANVAAGVVVGKLGTATVSPGELETALNPETSISQCITPVALLADIVKQLKQQGKRVVMTNGCFDLLHSGHIEYLEAARRLGDKLIVAVNDDNSVKHLKGNSRPINKLKDRLTLLAALKCVDWVVPFSEDTPEQLIQQINPTILVKGGDYEVSQIAGANWVKAQGGQVKVLGFKSGYSTSDLIHTIKRSDQ